MIIYQETKGQFLHDTEYGDIAEIVRDRYVAQRRSSKGVSLSEFNAWRESLGQMANVLRDSGIPPQCGIGIEYRIPASDKRIDFVITGTNSAGRPLAVIVELKRWSSSTPTDQDAIVIAHRGGKAVAREGPHPSYQAWSYACLLADFNSAAEEGKAELRPCAYLHNHPADGGIDGPRYREVLEKAPLFLKGESEVLRLREFIRRHVRDGDYGDLLWRFEGGEIRPSKSLADAVASMVRGNPEFVLIDDRKTVFEASRPAIQSASLAGGTKTVVIVRGGPGTGKSVVAVRLLTDAIAADLNARYVSKNAAPREVYATRLAGALSKKRIESLFATSGAFLDSEPNVFHALVVDEAHRLTEKSGHFQNLGVNQIVEVISAARATIFFVDDEQRVTLKDIGEAEEIREHAQAAGAHVTELYLHSQFRCAGADGYIAWVEDVLGIADTANDALDINQYDFRVVNSATELHGLIENRNANGRSRVVAGYCWDWLSKKDLGEDDIVLDDGRYRRKWNLNSRGKAWAISEGSIDEVGCIHTIQGLDLDYVGVIIGPDLRFEDGAVVADPLARAATDMSLRGIKGMLKKDPARAEELAGRIIRNTYRTLMTRGMQGCFVYCTDAALADHLRSRLSPGLLQIVDPRPDVEVPLVRAVECVPERCYAPVVDLAVAAGGFSDFQASSLDFEDWVEIPSRYADAAGLFVARVVGESMNRRIPNGAYCLFRLHPAGSRQGRAVLAQHRSIEDPDTGGRFTVKVYSSTKLIGQADEWVRERVVLRPDTDRAGYEPIVIEDGQGEDPVTIVAEVLDVLSPAVVRGCV